MDHNGYAHKVIIILLSKFCLGKKNQGALLAWFRLIFILFLDEH